MTPPIDPIDVQLHRNGPYYLARWRDSHGQRRSRSLGKRKDAGGELSERAARRECAAIATEMAIEPGKRDQADHKHTLGEWWVRFQVLRADLSPQSLRLYGDAAELMLEHWGTGKKLQTITHLQAADFAAHVERKYPNMQTARKHLRHAKGIFARAVKLKLIATNPFDGVHTVAPEVDKDWEHVGREDFERLLSHASSGWKAMLGLLRYAGLRRSEAIRMTWADVDFDARVMTVQNPGQVRTTKHRRREVPIQPELMRILVERFDDAKPAATVTGLTMNNLDRGAKAIIKRADLKVWGDIFHTLRRNCESEWMAKYPLLDICAWLGHSPKVASQHYHKVQQHVLDDVTGRTAEKEESELAVEREVNARLRKRIRRLIALARREESA